MMSKQESLGTRDEQIFCLFCRNNLINLNEQKLGYHKSCNREVINYKDELGYWYYLALVHATIEDCTLNSDENIIGLDLSAKGLTDLPKLPFKHLQELNLSRNYLDNVPDWVFELPDLKTIIFPGNGFSSSLLLDILRLNEQGINVISTGCTFNNKKHLIELNLSYLGPRLPVVLPEEITNLFTSVKLVNLSWNALEQLPTWIYSLPYLKYLNLQENRLASDSDTYFQSTQIEIVNLANNNLEYIPTWIYQLTHLKELNLSRNHIQSLPKGLLELPNLKWINFSQQFLSPDLDNDIIRLEQHGINVTFY